MTSARASSSRRPSRPTYRVSPPLRSRRPKTRPSCSASSSRRRRAAWNTIASRSTSAAKLPARAIWYPIASISAASFLSTSSRAYTRSTWRCSAAISSAPYELTAGLRCAPATREARTRRVRGSLARARSRPASAALRPRPAADHWWARNDRAARRRRYRVVPMPTRMATASAIHEKSDSHRSAALPSAQTRYAVPLAQMIPPDALAARNLGYGTLRDPASGPARMRSSATNRPKNTVHTPQRANMRSAWARCGGPRCLGNRRPSRSSRRRPPAPERVPEGVADDRAGTRRHRHPGDVDRARDGHQGRAHQRDLTRYRNAQALDADDRGDHEVDQGRRQGTQPVLHL